VSSGRARARTPARAWSVDVGPFTSLETLLTGM
jgi:hypothetical protein